MDRLMQDADTRRWLPLLRASGATGGNVGGGIVRLARLAAAVHAYEAADGVAGESPKQGISAGQGRPEGHVGATLRRQSVRKDSGR